MIDYLALLCSGLNINLVYTENKIIVLSTTIPNNNPTIRAHKVFKNCSEHIARAIVELCTNKENEDKNLLLLSDYLDKNFKSDNYKIKLPSNEFKNSVIKKMADKPIEEKKLRSIKTSSDLEEYRILRMSMINFVGDDIETNLKDEINIPDSDLIELNIVVDDTSTHSL